MARLKLVRESFQVVSGPFKGCSYIRGAEYDENDVPEQDKKKFEKVKEVAAETAPEKATKAPAADAKNDKGGK